MNISEVFIQIQNFRKGYENVEIFAQGVIAST